MADWYVVAGAAGGGNGLTYATAFNNCAAAYTAASNGDRIILDGLLVGSAFEMGGSSGYATIDKSLEFLSYTPYSCTVAPSIATGAFYINSAAYAGTLTIRDITISGADVAGGTTANYPIWTNSAVTHTIQLLGTKITNAVFYGINIDAVSSLVQLVLTDAQFILASGCREYLHATSLGATANLQITRLRIRWLAKNFASFALNIVGNLAGATVRITEQDIEVTNTINAGVHGGVFVANVDNVNIIGGRCKITGANTGAVAYGNQIDCTSLLLTAHRARIDDVDFIIDEGFGIAVLIGHDASNAFDNLTNYGLIRNCTVLGTAAFQAGFGHGIMLGNCTGGQINGGSADLLGIGALTKQSVDTLITGVSARRCNSAFFYFKGAVRARGAENKAYAGSGVAPAFQAAVGDNAVNCSGCFWGSNDINISGAASKIINHTAAQAVTYVENRYWQNTGATVPNPAATIAGVNYATLALTLAASDTNGQLTQNASIPNTPSIPYGYMSFPL